MFWVGLVRLDCVSASRYQSAPDVNSKAVRTSFVKASFMVQESCFHTKFDNFYTIEFFDNQCIKHYSQKSSDRDKLIVRPNHLIDKKYI